MRVPASTRAAALDAAAVPADSGAGQMGEIAIPVVTTDPRSRVRQPVAG